MRALPESRGVMAYGRALLLFCFIPLLPLTACRKTVADTTGISITSQIAPQPVKAGLTTITMSLTGADQRPLTQAHISVEGDMTHPGMSPVFAESKETAPGQYQAVLNLSMGGDWIVLLHVKTADGKTLERQIDLPGVLPN